MKKHIVVAVLAALGLFQGCMTWNMLNSKEEIQVKWERFKSLTPFPYVPVGLVTIDIAGKAACDLSQQVCNEVVIPYVELDKEGLICVYTQFAEEVEDVMKENGQQGKEAAVHHVLSLWTEKYGVEEVNRLVRALPIIQNLQTGNQFSKARARLLPQLMLCIATLREGIDQIKAEATNPIGIAKMVFAATQLLHRLEQLSWALHFLDVLEEDQAVETQAIAAYVASFQSKTV
mgnify:FL=1